MGKIVIGHAVHNDFKALSYTHPAALTRDTSKIPLLNLKAGFGEKECASLKRLTKAIFNRDIQVCEVMLICSNWFFDLRNHKPTSVVFCPFTSPPILALKKGCAWEFSIYLFRQNKWLWCELWIILQEMLNIFLGLLFFFFEMYFSSVNNIFFAYVCNYLIKTPICSCLAFSFA